MSNQSESIDLLAAALVQFQVNAPSVQKNAVNPHFKNRYADLSAIIEATRKPLTDAGLTIVQLPEGDELVTRVIHKSGQWIASRTALKCSKNDMQGYGSALSYGRRYAISAILNLAAEDDDAQAASKPSRPKVSQSDVAKVMAPVAGNKPLPYNMAPTYSEDETRKRLAKMFTPGAVGYVLEWAASSDRKSPTAPDKFTAAHFEALEKNRVAVEKYIEDKIFTAKKDPNYVDDGELWGGGKKK